MKWLLALLALNLCGMLPIASFAAAPVAPSTPPPVAATAAAQLDLNSASAGDFQAIRGIGPVLAQRIVDYRAKNGPFKKVDDLLGVAGIGTLNLEDFRPFLKVTLAK